MAAFRIDQFSVASEVARAGLLLGDVITRINDNEHETVLDLVQAVANAGGSFQLTYVRNGVPGLITIKGHSLGCTLSVVDEPSIAAGHAAPQIPPHKADVQSAGWSESPLPPAETAEPTAAVEQDAASAPAQSQGVKQPELTQGQANFIYVMGAAVFLLVLWFFNSDSKPAAPAREIGVVTPTQAMRGCKEMILQRVRHRSTVNFKDILGASYYVAPVNKNVRQVLHFEASNSFGVKSNFRAICIFTDEGTREVTIQEL